jgi:hypothetical protein
VVTRDCAWVGPAASEVRRAGEVSFGFGTTGRGAGLPAMLVRSLALRRPPRDPQSLQRDQGRSDASPGMSWRMLMEAELGLVPGHAEGLGEGGPTVPAPMMPIFTGDPQACGDAGQCSPRGDRLRQSHSRDIQSKILRTRRFLEAVISGLLTIIPYNH